MQFTLSSGTSLHLHDHSEFISDEIRRYKDYFERPLLDVIKSRFDVSVVVDIGANIGNHSHFFVNECGSRCYSFEPSSRNFSLLQANCPDQHLFNIALSNHVGSTQLFTYADSMGNNTLSELWDSPPPWGKNLNVEETIVLPLDMFAFPEVTFIKIDVEGAELRVLQGACNTIKRHLPIVLVEYGGDEGLSSAGIEYRSSDIVSYLDSLGYVYIGGAGGDNFFAPQSVTLF